MQFTIYFDDKPLVITDKLSAAQKKAGIDITDGFRNITGELSHAAILDLLKTAQDRSAIIVTDDVAALRDNIFNVYTLIEAAGGVVQNGKKEILFIHRRGKWDLPKGKLDAGETPEDCAAREIEEETGVGNLSRRKKIGDSYHIYSEKKTNILKKTYWYHFTTDDRQKLTGQAEEDITEVKWIPTQKISEPMSETYESIREVMAESFDKP